MPHFPFDAKLWAIGRQIEDDALPLLNSRYECDFKRNENDIFDILDFKDDDKKIIVEVKGRRNAHDKYKETIITASKITAGYLAIEQGYKVYFIFVFNNNKIFEYELKDGAAFNCKYTGTNCIQHYLIPLKECKEIKEDVEPEAE